MDKDTKKAVTVVSKKSVSSKVVESNYEVVEVEEPKKEDIASFIYNALMNDAKALGQGVHLLPYNAGDDYVMRLKEERNLSR